MASAPNELSTSTNLGEPTWEVARLFPAQGTWSEAEYLELNANRLVEFSAGHLEVLTMPTTAHQFMVAYLYGMLLGFVTPRNLGKVIFAPLRVRLWAEKYREPDLIFMMRAHLARIGREFWDGADLVMEVVSDDDRRRDLETKRFEYARAGIPEYWIVNPLKTQITVLRLDGDHYLVHGEFAKGTQATSALLNGFSVDVAAVFAAGDEVNQTL